MPTSINRRNAWLVASFLPILTCTVGTLFTWNWLPCSLGTGCGLTLVTLLLVTMYTDSKWKKIPNWATYPAFVWLLLFNVFASCGLLQADASAALGAIGIGPSLLGALCCFCVMVVLSGWLQSSGGDVKLMTVIGACVGVKYGLLAMCLGYILAGSCSSVVCVWHYGIANIARGVMNWIGNLFFPFVFDRPEVQDDQLLRTGVPLGAYFTAGTVLALTQFVPGVHF